MDKAKYIDPIIGTVGDEQDESMHGGGKTYPGACLPGGMVQLSPDTVTGGDNGTGYNYCHNTIEGFSFNHLSGIGWYGDMGNIQVMPVIGETDLRSGSNEEVTFKKGKEGWKSPFSHEKETAKAGYYSVFLDRYKTLAEATVTQRTGMLRFTYPEDADARIIFNLSRRIGGHADFEKVDIVNSSRIEGHIHCTPAGGGLGRGSGKISYDLFFACELSVPANKMQFFSNEEFVDESIKHLEDEDVGILAFFGNGTKEICVKCSVSYVSLDGARKNMEQECPDFDFDKMAEKAFDTWEKAFDGVEVCGSDETDLKIFYTCLYHTLLDPRIAADVDGKFSIDGKIYSTDQYTHRTVFSGWDVYRSEFPLLSIIRPDMVSDNINSLVKTAECRGTSFPKWEVLGNDSGSMVGDPGLIVIADAHLKGITTVNPQKTYDIAKASCLGATELFGKTFKSLRPDCRQYKEDCYYPEKLSDTLEFLLADFTMAKFAEAMDKGEDAQYFAGRAKRYGENYNRLLGFMAPRHPNGRFVFEWGKYGDNGCVESNIYQQSWFVPYDIKGLSRLFGEKRTVRLLEKFFKKADFKRLWNNDYNHSNEPCHNITHYFSMLGLPHRTQYWTRRIQKEAYRTGPFGFCGNEDVGQLSAWYVLSAFGFAQLCPAYDAYFINTPLFRTAEIRLDPKYHSCSVSETLSIECSEDPLEYPYIKSVYLNGQEIQRAYLTYKEIVSGGKIRFELSKEPCREFGKEVPENFF